MWSILKVFNKSVNKPGLYKAFKGSLKWEFKKVFKFDFTCALDIHFIKVKWTVSLSEMLL